MEERLKLQEQLDAINAFMHSAAFSSYKHTMNADLSVVDEQLLTVPPDTSAAVAALNQLHGSRQTLLAQLSFFEDSRRTLEARIAVLVDAENEAATTKL